MQRELSQLIKLLERKKSYLQTVTNERTRVAVQVEINIIESYVSAVDERLNEVELFQESQQKEAEAEKEMRAKLLLICELHGIDLGYFILRSNDAIADDLKRDKAENCLRIPNKLIKTFYGEKD